MKRLCLLLAAVFVSSAAHTAAAAGDAEAGKAVAAPCAACHGANGHSINPEWPNLAAQHARYTAKQLADFKAGETRKNDIMAQQVASLSEQEMVDLGAYFATLAPAGGFVSEDKLELGEKIYRAGSLESGVPACIACHGPTGAGDPNGVIPVLSGQRIPYTVAQLKAFRNGTRSNDRNGMMRGSAHRLTDVEIEAVSEYVAGLH